MKPIIAAVSCFIALLANPASATSCSASSSGVAFGAYLPNQAAPADSAGLLTVTCSKGVLEIFPVTVNYTVEFSRGNSAAYSPRELTSGANKLRYNLYNDASRANVWGNATGGTSHTTGSIGLLLVLVPVAASHTIYGRIFASQNAVPGTYADSIVVTIVY
ncbi:MAG: spore coat U domain-containing protein [Usitatibacteraceae bacterium]